MCEIMGVARPVYPPCSLLCASHNVSRREEAKTSYDKFFEDKSIIVKPKGIAIQIWGGKDALAEALDSNQAWEAEYDENMICWREGSQTRRIGAAHDHVYHRAGSTDDSSIPGITRNGCM